MKKLKLMVEELEVTSFTAEEDAGAVHAHATHIDACRTEYLCTHQEGCYPSLYCSAFHGCMITLEENCWTNEHEYCPIGTTPVAC